MPETMKALSLLQPWASAIMVGLKTYETRSWYTLYQGRIAIHASKGFPMENRLFAAELSTQGYRLPDALPLGAVLGTARLVNVQRVEDVEPFIGRVERLFGDYSGGRFAWLLEDIEIFEEPIPARGRLGLWEWDAPEVSHA